MKFNELQDALLNIRLQIAELDDQRSQLKNRYSIDSIVIEDGFRIKGFWRCSPETGITYKLEFVSKANGLFCECFDGSMYKRQEIPSEIESRFREIHQLLLSWLNDEIAWPFSEERL